MPDEAEQVRAAVVSRYGRLAAAAAAGERVTDGAPGGNCFGAVDVTAQHAAADIDVGTCRVGRWVRRQPGAEKRGCSSFLPRGLA